MTAMLVKQEDKGKYMKFTVMYKVEASDAVVVMDAACESLSALYRIVYAMAGKKKSIGAFYMFFAHQKLENGDVIELDKAGFTRAIRETRVDDEARDEAAAIAAELTGVNSLPPLMEKVDTSYARNYFEVLPIKKAKWRIGYESFVR